jgi:1-deoxy-D-xylulose-5-phosphate reductoisomerase
MSIMSKTITVLGSTGSIGVQTLDVAERFGYKVEGISAYSNVKLAEEQCRKFGIKQVCIGEKYYSQLKTALADTDTVVTAGESAVSQMAHECKSEVLYNSVMGIAGMKPTLAALRGGVKKIAFANKETLVAGGSIVMKEAKRQNAVLLPVDSEHSAIFQCLQGGGEVRKILLTASGGPFFGKKREDLENITVEDALNHPNWSMGAKITIDSSTMMNKGLEIIEAAHLFGVSPDDIEVVVHRESIIHSMVEFCDGAVIAQLGSPDMRLCIQYAATYPDRLPSSVKPLNFAEIGKLTFYKPDRETFTLLDTATWAFIQGGNIPAAMNGANEEAVALFLQRKIKYLQIFDIVREAAENAVYIKEPTEADIFDTDKAAREYVKSRIG